MIQRTHLTAWQFFAPWPKRSQIEQDLRLSRGVAAIFADSVLADHLAMRGGTVLHKAHLAPAARYSEDIDLVLVKAMDTDVLDQHLRRVLTPVLGQPADSLIDNAWLAIRNVVRPSKILRTTYRFVPLGLQREEVIKVEVNLNEQKSLYPLVAVELDALDDDGDTVRVKTRSYDINEMLGTKTRALMQREQGRDLFDLFHAWRLSEMGATPYAVDGAKALEAFTWYLEQEGTQLGIGEAKRSSMHGCASADSGGTWIRCCVPVCRRLTSTALRPWCGKRISSICGHREIGTTSIQAIQGIIPTCTTR